MSIIISKNGKHLQKLNKQSFQDENELQKYLYDNPEAIPLYEIDEDIKVCILARELETESGPIDAFGVDINGNAYIIETKLYKNNDKRRVIAQMLDYGASIWQHGGDFTSFTTILDNKVHQKFNIPLKEKLIHFFEIDSSEVDQLLVNLKSDINEGMFQFVVLMDELDNRLKDLILYVNQNSQFNIYAVQIDYYKFENYELVIPKLFGNEIKKSNSIKSAPKGTKLWDKELFLDTLNQTVSVKSADNVTLLFKFADTISFSNKGFIEYGKGVSSGSITLKIYSANKINVSLFRVDTNGFLDVISENWDRNTKHPDIKKKYVNLITKLSNKFESLEKNRKVAIKQIDVEKLNKSEVESLIDIYSSVIEEIRNISLA